MYALIDLIALVLHIAQFVLFVTIVMSWLISFNLVNTRHPFVYRLNQILHQITDPVLRPIRKVVPPIGGLDFSPLIAFLILYFLERFVLLDLVRYVG
jgi:YggT family protein